MLLLVLLVAPFHEHRRASAAYRLAAAIRLPSPDRISAGAVVAVRRAVERIEAFDLARELPAPLAQVDLSDLAYRLWHEGETQAPSSALIAYEVFDGTGSPAQPLLVDPGDRDLGRLARRHPDREARSRGRSPAGHAVGERKSVGPGGRVRGGLAELGSAPAAPGGVPAAGRSGLAGRESASSGAGLVRAGRHQARRGPRLHVLRSGLRATGGPPASRSPSLPRPGAAGRAAAPGRRFPAGRHPRARPASAHPDRGAAAAARGDRGGGRGASDGVARADQPAGACGTGSRWVRRRFADVSARSSCSP